MRLTLKRISKHHITRLMRLTVRRIFSARKKEDAMRKRNRHVSVWMNEQEYRHLKKQAELAGLGVDPFLRALAAGVQLRPRPPDTYAALLRELSAIGNNVNQIAYWANATKGIGKAEIAEAAALVRQAWRMVKETL